MATPRRTRLAIDSPGPDRTQPADEQCRALGQSTGNILVIGAVSVSPQAISYSLEAGSASGIALKVVSC